MMVPFYLVGLIGVLFMAYLSIAKYFRIVDVPNHRSSHDQITIRGGGIIIPVAYWLSGLFFGFQYPLFSVGLLLLTVISFLDDIYSVSAKTRLLVQFLASFLLVFQMDLIPSFGSLQIAFVGLLVIFIVGVINVYNFMDGINGMTALYSLSILIPLVACSYMTNRLVYQDSFLYVVVALLVFALANVRRKAICFAGDVGSVSIAYLILFFLISQGVVGSNFPLILFVSVYLMDGVYTMVRRMIIGENIFEAHRSHLYQLMVNEQGYSHVVVSSMYAVAQLIINGWALYLLQLDVSRSWIFTSLTLLLLILIYTGIRLSLGSRQKNLL